MIDKRFYKDLPIRLFMVTSEIFYEVDRLLSYNSEYGLLIVLFLMFFILIFIGVKKVLFVRDGERGIVAIIAIVVSLLAVRYMSVEQLLIITTTYSYVGFFIWFFLPFFMVVMFSHTFGMIALFRRGIILVFGIVFYCLLPIRNSLSDILNLIAIGGLVFAIVFDGQIQKFVLKHKKS